jgi:uncharacterized protein YycO
MRRCSSLLLLFVTCVALTGCGSSVLVHRPADQRVDRALTQMWTQEIRRVARDGDWLLVRSYAAVGDAIVVLTSGEEITHAALYDGARGTVIEAITPAVREISLEALVARNRHIMVVRPRATAAAQRAAVLRARTKLGTGFDLRGMFGIANRPDNFYCSELVYWASGLAARDPDPPRIITPASLLAHGEVVYWSGRRDDPQLARIAAGWIADHAPTRVATAR